MLVREVMTARPTTVPVAASVKQALGVLARERVTTAPVVDVAGSLRGVVSEADLIREAVPRDPRAHELLDAGPRVAPPRLVAEVMTPRAVTVRPDTELAVAVELMTCTSVKSLPVVEDDGHLVGMISRSDVVRLLARADWSIERDVAGLLADAGRPDWLVEVVDGVVEVSGPGDEQARSLARAVAVSVPGVIDVQVS